MQMGAMSSIFDTQKEKKMKGIIKDFVVRVPQANVRFLHCSEIDSPDPSQEEQDQYDFLITKVALAARTDMRSTKAGENDNKSRTSFHFRMESAEASAAERFANMDETHAAVKANIKDIIISMGSRDVSYIDGDIGVLRASSSSGKVVSRCSDIQDQSSRL
ncbi:hypothetical protein BJ170DRAFT_688620 [Xylariales sp. AK1849]|nr:hypothetical protein BJ170DRAFT_688620 [Xylariales sp. AK1849]